MDRSEVQMAVISMQQLPKIHNALSNMARRSRRRLERQGIFLGGCWLANNEELLPKQRGILKSSMSPNLGQLSSYNDFWRSFSHPCKTDELECRTTSRDSMSLRRPHGASDFAPFPVLSRISQSYEGNKEICKPKSVALLDSFPVQFSNIKSLKEIDLAYLNNNLVNPKEREIVLELQHLKTLSFISFHKLLRKRPLEYVLPLPRKTPRIACSRVKSLVAYQSVQNLPTYDYKMKWLRFNSKNYTKSFSEFGNDPPKPRVFVSKKGCKKGKCFYATTMPKGVAFLTYPDYLDNTSFEGTIGGRNVISWEQGTRFPQMGIDQSESFKLKKELGKQQMLRNRLQAANRFQKRIGGNAENTDSADLDRDIETIRSRNSFFYTPRKKSRPHKYYCKKHKIPLVEHERRSYQPYFKLKSFLWNPFRSSRECRVEATSSTSNSLNGTQTMRLPSNTEVRKRFSCREQAVVRAERRKRLKICFKVTIGCLSCGIIPLLTKGECIFWKRRLRTVQTEDSRETEGPILEGLQPQ